MTVKHFLLALEQFTGLQLEFYFAKRSKSIHMGLNRCILSVTNNQEIISDIYEHFQYKEWKFDCRFVYPILINKTKWKFDYIIFKKKYSLIFI